MKYPTTEAGWWQSEFEATCELLRAERKKIAALTAVAEAAREVHAQTGSYSENGVRLGAALDALDGER